MNHRGGQGGARRPRGGDHYDRGHAQRGANQDDRQDRQRAEERGQGQRRRLNEGDLQEILQREPDDLVTHIANKNSRFPDALQNNNLLSKPRPMALVLQVIAKALESNLRESVLQVLQYARESQLLKGALTSYLTVMMVEGTGPTQRGYRVSLKCILKILRELLKRLPTSFMLCMPAVSVIETTIGTLRINTSLIDDEIEELFTSLKERSENLLANEQRNYAAEAGIPQEGPNGTEGEEDITPPPNNYREMSIFPGQADMVPDPPFLRKIIIKGGFEDVAHYLDVQFRLLREDFVRPVREGILEYRKIHDDGEHFEGRGGGIARQWPKRLRDVRIYHDVHILHPVCAQNGMYYKIRFDVSKLKSVRWQYTKRLIYGSLLCISEDDFRSFYIATVADRKSEDLAEGYLMIKFEMEEQNRDIHRIRPDQKFLMLETSAYFEAYRHVLQAMKDMHDEDIPFVPNIVNCRKEINRPRYLLREDEPTYNLTPLAPERKKGDLTEAEISEYERVDRELASVEVMNTNRWPKAETFGIDESQLSALKVALTRELSIIQGPPGTGKTFIGLKVVEALLKNKNIWTGGLDTPEDNFPILIVCYTNHALDQFLEGISTWIKSYMHGDRGSGIVRVGGRSKSKLMENFLLNNLRRQIRTEHTVPQNIHAAKREARSEMEMQQILIEEAAIKMESMERGLIHEKNLKPFISDHHYESLMEAPVTDEGSGILFSNQTQRHSPSRLPEWLGLVDNIFTDLANQDEEGDANQAAGGAENLAGHPVEGNAAEAPGINAQPNNQDDDDDDDEDDDDNVVQGEEAQRRLLVDEEDGDLHHRDEMRRENHDRAVREHLAVDFDDFARFAEEQEAAYARMRGQEWNIPQKARKNRRQKLRRHLRSSDAMNDREADRVGNIWELNARDRWRLYRFWLKKYQRDLKRETVDHEERYMIAAARLRESLEREDEVIMRRASVIGMTTTGAARYHQALGRIRPRIIIVEEAAEVLESHILTTLSPDCQHLVLIGDHLQLRPSASVYELQEKYNLKYSMFERLVNNELELHTLQRQHRMRPEISDLMRLIYPKLEDDDSVDNYENIRGIEKNLALIHMSGEEERVEDMKSFQNLLEARFIVELCRYLKLQGYKTSRITVLTPYAGQMYLLRKLMPRKDSGEFDGLRVCPIDNYQGEENDIIILSLVRSGERNIKKASIGFVKDENRACVAMSRARMGLYVVGNFEHIAKCSDMWSKFVQRAREKGHYDNHVLLCCVNHPNDSRIRAWRPEEFKKAPEGGCSRPCDFRLNCGHVCERMCHSYDREHKQYLCDKLCGKRLACGVPGHYCKGKCHPRCRPCDYLVKRKLLKCGHEQEMKCHETALDFICREPCSELLKCEHPCPNKCGEPHSIQCNVKVKIKLKCGHKATTGCSARLTTIPKCLEPCSVQLDCGHTCAGNCSECLHGRVHVPCQSKCGRILVCGHECPEPCTKDCPPCSRPCENRCSHSACKKLCGQPCVLCIEKCDWQCEHARCSRLCNEPCNRLRCDKECTRRLPCGHQCVGVCGEPCPKLCRVCNHEELTTIFFGNEDEPAAKFVKLEDCPHAIEMTALDKYMDEKKIDEKTGALDIQLKKCPLCNVTIRRNLRYSHAINTMLKDIEEVKKRIQTKGGSREEMRAKQTELRLKLRTLEMEERLRENKNFYEERLNMATLSSDELICIENVLNFLEHHIRWKVAARELRTHMVSRADEQSRSTLRELLAEIHEAQSLESAILRKRVLMSPQELTELGQEVTRFDLVKDCLQISHNLKNGSHPRVEEDDRGKLQIMIKMLKNGFALDKETEADAEKLLEKLKKSMTGLGISDRERVEIVQAIGLEKGHWFKCPNGHIYAIGDCGGATVEGICPECKAVIGGGQHRLRSDNRFAPEMDGATATAWPGTAMNPNP